VPPQTVRRIAERFFDPPKIFGASIVRQRS
jgi:hypothetical protein